ncbi:MAG: ABC transporter substrate-binding protein [Aigarchaeota archaeon]|nr:ABC transporter substrate-binding protein [Candidatus Pelearchaeum maunauluense]
MSSSSKLARREFIKYALAAGAGLAVGRLSASLPTAPAQTHEASGEAETIPEGNVKVGVQTFFSGPGAVVGECLYKGAVLAAEQINQRGGILGKRKIEIVARDEAGVEQTVKEFRRLAINEKVDYYVGAIESVNTIALGPEAESLGLLTIFVDGGTEKLFVEILAKPRVVFRTSNIDTVDAFTTMNAVAYWFSDARRVAQIYPDDVYGQLTHEVVEASLKKLLPDAESVYTGWPPLFTTDYSPHITKLLETRPDVLVIGLWGGDFLTFYKQALAYGVFKETRLVSTYGFSAPPHYFGKDLPEGSIMGAHANYYFLYPPWERSERNREFNRAYYDMWNEYPGTHAELAYSSMMALIQAIERAYSIAGSWPDVGEVAEALAGSMAEAPGGYLYYRREDHQAVRNPPIGRAVNEEEWPFPVWDIDDVLQLPAERYIPPPGVKMVDWIKML